jgi:hypothetical protein
MTVRLDLKPEVEAYLATQARARGVALDAYLKGVLEDLARSEAAPPASAPDLTGVLDALAEMGKGLPILPPSALTRDSIYEDHN